MTGLGLNTGSCSSLSKNRSHTLWQTLLVRRRLWIFEEPLLETSFIISQVLSSASLRSSRATC